MPKTEDVLWFIGIASIAWLFFAVLTISLCVMVRRADEDLMTTTWVEPDDVGFVASLTAVPGPAPAEPVLPRPASRTTR